MKNDDWAGGEVNISSVERGRAFFNYKDHSYNLRHTQKKYT